MAREQNPREHTLTIYSIPNGVEKNLGAGRLQYCNLRSPIRRKIYFALSLVVVRHDETGPFGCDFFGAEAVDVVRHQKSIAHDVFNSGCTEYLVRVSQWCDKGTIGFCKYWTDKIVRRDDLCLVEIGYSSRFEIAKVHTVIDVLEGIHFPPLNGQRYLDGMMKIGQEV